MVEWAEPGFEPQYHIKQMHACNLCTWKVEVQRFKALFGCVHRWSLPGLEAVPKGGAREGRKEKFPECAAHPCVQLPFPLLTATLKVFGEDDPDIVQNVLNPEGVCPCGKEGVTRGRLLVVGARSTENCLTSSSAKESETHAILKGEAKAGTGPCPAPALLFCFLLLPQISLA